MTTVPEVTVVEQLANHVQKVMDLVVLEEHNHLPEIMAVRSVLVDQDLLKAVAPVELEVAAGTAVAVLLQMVLQMTTVVEESVLFMF